jgi:hypothetical protein
MAYFDRFDICEAHLLVEQDWHVGGWLRERPSNQRRREATSVQLARMQFKPAPGLSVETLSENGREIYDDLVARYRLSAPTSMNVEEASNDNPPSLRPESQEVTGQKITS